MSRLASRPFKRRSSSVRPQIEILESRYLPSVSFAAQPVVPIIDAITQAHLRSVLAAGLRQGNRPNVFAKIGDSITASEMSLSPLGMAFFNPVDPTVVGTHT